jgi:hypothetical protein
MASQSRFAQISFEEIEQMKENAVPQNTKQATKYGVKLFKGMTFSLLIKILTIFLIIYK